MLRLCKKFALTIQERGCSWWTSARSLAGTGYLYIYTTSKMAVSKGLEPSTSRVTGGCSSQVELRDHRNCGAEDGARTRNLRVGNAKFYQLKILPQERGTRVSSI